MRAAAAAEWAAGEIHGGDVVLVCDQALRDLNQQVQTTTVSADDGSLSRLTVRARQVRPLRRRTQKEMVVMGLIRKAASILTLGGVGNHGRRDPQAKAAKGQAALAEAETEVAEEQTAVIANALHEALAAIRKLGAASVGDKTMVDALGPARRDVKNFLHGTWLGHPLHPVMTDIPLGAWTATLLLDAIRREATLVHLYPDLLGTYGDRGNALAFDAAAPYRRKLPAWPYYYKAADAGVDATIYEASNHVGGRMHSDRIGRAIH